MSNPLFAARRSLFALTSVALALSAHAAAPNQLETVVTTATRSPQRLADVLADLTVITRADIERTAAASLADLLRASGCAELSRNGGPAGTTSLYLRGAETRHTLLLIDGVRVDSQATGGPAWNNIPIAQIERVEVLKGPASSLYGSDAVGGVVQVFTRKATSAPQVDLGVGAGNLGIRKLDAAVTGRDGIFDYALSAALDRSTGFNATLDVPGSFSYVPDTDGYRKHQATARLGAQLSSEHRAELVFLKNHLNSQYDASKFSPTNDDHTFQDTKAMRLSWSAQWSAVLQTQLSMGESQDRYETRPSPYQTETRIRNTALTGSYRLGAGQQLNFALERTTDHLDNSGLVAGGVDDRAQNALGLGWLMNAGALNLQLHARHDDDSQFGGVNTGTLLAGYALTPALRVVGSVGNAFRAPTLYQRGSVYGPDLSKPGVKALDAERGHNAEIGLKFAMGDHEASITTYRNRVGNLIVFGAAGSCGSSFGCYENVSQALLKGTSLAGRARLGVVNLSATLDFQSPTDASTGKLLARRAKRLATLRADTELAGWQIGAGVQAAGQRFDNAANTKPLAGYALVTLDAAYRLQKDLKLQVNIDNATNRDYQTAGGFASQPRTVVLSLRWSPQL
jgi:vitamin B12 transporter